VDRYPLLHRARPVIMGVLNLTPDSFSDGGRYGDAGAAVARARAMVAEGAEIIDVGGESTRPGARRIPPAEQKARVLEVMAGLAGSLPEGVLVSIDTTRAEVAAAALDAGAGMLNDVSAGREDPEMLALAAARRVPVALMHMQGEPATMQRDPRYDDVVGEVCAFLAERARAAEAAGVDPAGIVLDPGIGFGKTQAHNEALMAHLDRLVALGYPVLLGASRKRFLGGITGEEEAHRRVGATCATTVIGVQAGVRLFRVHDVRENRQAAEVAWRLAASGG
jgi:dihydropteroate synthase